MNKKSLISAIVVSLLLIAAGWVALHYLQQYFQQYQVTTVSSLVNKHTEHEDTSEIESTTVENIIHKNQKRVVQVLSKKGSTITQGSGFIYNNKGDIITNAHVVKGAAKVTIKTSDAKMLTGKVIGVGDKKDVAVIRVPELADRSPVQIEKKHMAEIGDPVIALGSPLGIQNSVIPGVIQGVHRHFKIHQYVYNNAYQISAPITYGNSGGPLLNRKTGEVIAINSAASDNSSVGYSIPISNVLDMVTEWSKHPQDIEGYDGTVSKHYNNGMPSQKDARYIVKYFYKNISLRDYVTAYSLLSGSWQAETSYKTFRQGFMNTLNVKITSISSKEKNNSIIVEAKITAKERKKQKLKKIRYKVTYTVGLENDQLKLLKGTGKKIASKPLGQKIQLKDDQSS